MTRFLISLTPEATRRVNAWIEEANKDFDEGQVTASDCIEDIVLKGATPDIAKLRLRKTDIPRYLKKLAREKSLTADSVLTKLRAIRAVEKESNSTARTQEQES